MTAGVRSGAGGLGPATDTFKALAHPTRLRILALLRPGALCVCQMTAVLEVAVSTVSAHLADLKRAGLLKERKDGRFVSYSLADGAAVQATLDLAWKLAKGDPQVASDARLAKDLRLVPVEELCRVELDVSRFGLARSAARG
ncbi:MAG: metalloregulator ArsR/SmtB family transcription factor [Vicinamibacteria bacterium]|jgi:DNA-binding transcriptional ArsR family regulator|nr:metalloregulator ArsR/SmtB family transcription factor [Vicinamibacteria bacterium]